MTEPMFVVRSGVSRDPVKWTVVGGFLVLRSMAAGVALAVALALVCSPLFGIDPEAIPVLWLCMTLLVAGYLIQRRVGADNGSFRFHEDAVEIDWRPRRGVPMQAWVDYEDLTYLAMSARDRMLMVFGLPAPGNAIEVPVEPRGGEDAFDYLIEHIERRFPNHLMAVLDDGHLRYTHTWTFAERYSQMGAVLRVCVAAHGAAWRVTLERGDGGRTMEFGLQFRSFWRVVSDRKTILARSGSWLTDGEGLVLAGAESRDGTVAVEFGLGEDFAVDRSSIRRDGEAVGRVQSEDGQRVFTFHGDQPAMVALTLAVAACTTNRGGLTELRDPHTSPGS